MAATTRLAAALPPHGRRGIVGIRYWEDKS
ncbi:hypothetical protein ABIE62_002800 [Porphyrobacter sp. MBR-155]